MQVLTVWNVTHDIWKRKDTNVELRFSRSNHYTHAGSGCSFCIAFCVY